MSSCSSGQLGIIRPIISNDLTMKSLEDLNERSDSPPGDVRLIMIKQKALVMPYLKWHCLGSLNWIFFFWNKSWQQNPAFDILTHCPLFCGFTLENNDAEDRKRKPRGTSNNILRSALSILVAKQINNFHVSDVTILGVSDSSKM